MTNTLYELFAKKNPDYDLRFDSLLRQYTDYGKGYNEFTESKAKILGAAYELYIVAFFIGLYSNRTKALNPDPSKRTNLGYPIANWGNLENRKMRKAYPQIREFIFMALLARTDIDFIAVDKGEIPVERAASELKKKMEEYANYGFDYIHEKLEEDSTWLSRNASLLNLFISFSDEANNNPKTERDDEPEDI